MDFRVYGLGSFQGLGVLKGLLDELEYTLLIVDKFSTQTLNPKISEAATLEGTVGLATGGVRRFLRRESMD